MDPGMDLVRVPDVCGALIGTNSWLAAGCDGPWGRTTAPRLPPPVRSEPGAVPFNHGLRLHDLQRAEHLRSQTIQAGEYQTVQHPERWPFRRFPPQHVKLMTQNRVFSLKRDPRPERSDQRQPN